MASPTSSAAFPVTPSPVNDGKPKASSTGTPHTRHRRTISSDFAVDKKNPQMGSSIAATAHHHRRTSSSDSSAAGNKIFKVYKYVDQDLLQDSAATIELLRQENGKLKQRAQRQEKAMDVLRESNDKLLEANELSTRILQSLLQYQQLPPEDIAVACKENKEAQQMAQVTQAMLEILGIDDAGKH